MFEMRLNNQILTNASPAFKETNGLSVSPRFWFTLVLWQPVKDVMNFKMKSLNYLILTTVVAG